MFRTMPIFGRAFMDGRDDVVTVGEALERQKRALSQLSLAPALVRRTEIMLLSSGKISSTRPATILAFTRNASKWQLLLIHPALLSSFVFRCGRAAIGNVHRSRLFHKTEVLDYFLHHL